MAIQFQCSCGRPLRAPLDAAGKKTRCPGCNHVLTIPGAATKPVAATAPAGAASASIPVSGDEGDPFAPELDWSSLAARPAAEAETSRPASGVIKVDSSVADVAAVDPPRTEDGSRQYRVLGQKEQGFVGKFHAGKLEEVLNAHARQGWALKAAVTMSLPGHGGNHDELIVILER